MIRQFTRFDIVHSLVGGALSGDSDTGPFKFLDGQTPPTDAEIDAEMIRVEAAEPMRILRRQRNLRLTETDWWVLRGNPTNDQQVYRQQLRDMPDFVTPSLDGNGQLTGVTWPEIPE